MVQMWLGLEQSKHSCCVDCGGDDGDDDGGGGEGDGGSGDAEAQFHSAKERQGYREASKECYASV